MSQHNGHADHKAIVEQVYRYAYGIDLRDWDLYRSIYTDHIEVDFSSYSGGKPGGRIAVDDWIVRVRAAIDGLDATQHSMSNPLVDIDGDTARCRMYMQAAHFLEDWPEPEFTIGGYYDDQLVRTADGWRIEAVKLTIWWRRGDPALMVEAAKRAAANG